MVNTKEKEKIPKTSLDKLEQVAKTNKGEISPAWGEGMKVTGMGLGKTWLAVVHVKRAQRVSSAEN